jgi:hypothetical protein
MVQTYVRGISSKRRGAKSKFYDISVDVNLPSLQGILSASQIGTIFAAELVDFIRGNWEQGNDATGHARHLNDGAVTVRRIQRTVMENVTLDTKIGRKEAYKAAVVKNYILVKRSQYNIGGLKTKVTQKAKYVPDIGAKPLMSSGLMHDSLAGTYVPSRQRTVNGHPVVTAAWIRLRVANVRNFAAYEYGGLRPENSQYFINALRNNPAAFKYTNSLINSAVSWVPQNKPAVTVGNVMTAVMHVMRLIAKI